MLSKRLKLLGRRRSRSAPGRRGGRPCRASGLGVSLAVRFRRCCFRRCNTGIVAPVLGEGGFRCAGLRATIDAVTFIGWQREQVIYRRLRPRMRQEERHKQPSGAARQPLDQQANTPAQTVQEMPYITCASLLPALVSIRGAPRLRLLLRRRPERSPPPAG